MVSPGYNYIHSHSYCVTHRKWSFRLTAVFCSFLLKYRYVAMIIRATRTRNVGITSLYCDVILTFGTGAIILVNIMLVVVGETAKPPNKMTANISVYTVHNMQQQQVPIWDGIKSIGREYCTCTRVTNFVQCLNLYCKYMTSYHSHIVLKSKDMRVPSATQIECQQYMRQYVQ